jgi:hypothetical protein
MSESQLIGRHVSEFAGVLGYPIAVPNRPPEGDPEFGLDRYIECKDLGFTILIDWNDVASCIQFFSEGCEPGYRGYVGSLPRNLSFRSSRNSVRDIMGVPVQSSNGGPEKFGIEHRPWDWFVFAGRKVHFEYQNGCEAIRMVSVMTLPEET